MVAHVDDLLASGDNEDLLELRQELQERFECDGDLLGLGGDEVQSLSFLGRTIRWTVEGLEWSGDEKQACILVERAGLGEETEADGRVRRKAEEGQKFI